MYYTSSFFKVLLFILETIQFSTRLVTVAVLALQNVLKIKDTLAEPDWFID